MIDCMYDDIKVRYYALNDEIRDVTTECDFLLAKTSPDDIERIVGLEQKGFIFHNRTILGEINLSSVSETLIRMIRADVRTDKEFSMNLYELARKAFATDRRFHLTKQFDQNLANKIIEGYIRALSTEDVMLFKCFHKEKLTGFTIVKRLDDIACENMLGAVNPLYQSRGVAINLYSYMLKVLRDEGYMKLYGRISTTNVASINLHIALGAKYSLPEDDYILRQKEW